MSSAIIQEAARAAIGEIWRVLAPHGSIEGAFAAFCAGHIPEKGPYWYSATVYNGLTDVELDELEAQLPYPIPEQTKAIIPAPMRALLSVTNGMHLHNLSIYGQYGRRDHGVGAPIGLGDPQLARPFGVPKTWFCIGSMNGPWFSQGTLYLTGEQEVVLVHRDTGDIGARWPGLAEFLWSEVPRLLQIHDAKGDPRPGESLLPGNTGDWETKAEIAQCAKLGWRYRVKQSLARVGLRWPS